MNGNRIWLDLAAFIDGPRGQSCVFVDHEKVKTVKDVEDHIRSLFKIESPFYISNDGWFLPSSESSLLLRDNDTVSVVPASGLILSHASQKSIIDVAEKDFISNIHQPGHSGKATQALSDRENNVLNSSGDIASNLKNPFARPRSPEVPLDRPNVEEEQPNLKNPFARPSSSEVPSVKPHLEEAPLKNPELPNGHLSVMKVELDIGHSFNHESESAEKKRKRIRRRKRKSTLQVDEPKPKEPHQSRYVMNKLLQGVSHILKPSISKQEQLVNKKHIFFNDEECLKYDSNAAPQGVTEDEIGRDEIPVLPICTPPVLETDLSKLISLGNQKSPVVFERKKSENAQVVNPKPQVKLTPLNEMPVKEALFKFKILKMVNYSPTVSEQITARVISSDFSTQQIYVSILDGLNEFQTDNGKFSIEEDDSVEPSNPYKLLDWQSLIEPMSFV